MLKAPSSCNKDRLHTAVRCFVRPVCLPEVAEAVYHMFPVEHWD